MAPTRKSKPASRRPAAPQKRKPEKARSTAKAKSATKTSLKKSAPKRVQLQDRVFAGVHHKSGRVATIREVIASDIPTRTGKELSLDERARLATRRIKENDHFVSMRMLGVQGVIDKKRALEEIKKLSHIGLHLLEIDMRHARLQTEQSFALGVKKRRENGSGNNDRN
jgi:hypothetical protein